MSDIWWIPVKSEDEVFNVAGEGRVTLICYSRGTAFCSRVRKRDGDWVKCTSHIVTVVAEEIEGSRYTFGRDLPR